MNASALFKELRDAVIVPNSHDTSYTFASMHILLIKLQSHYLKKIPTTSLQVLMSPHLMLAQNHLALTANVLEGTIFIMTYQIFFEYEICFNGNEHQISPGSLLS